MPLTINDAHLADANYLQLPAVITSAALQSARALETGYEETKFSNWLRLRALLLFRPSGFGRLPPGLDVIRTLIPRLAPASVVLLGKPALRFQN